MEINLYAVIGELYVKDIAQNLAIGELQAQLEEAQKATEPPVELVEKNGSKKPKEPVEVK
jgi:hypothetical protein